MMGWLEKQKGGMFGRKWQKRWFELEAHYLVYKAKETGEILAAIDMRGVDSVVVEFPKEKNKGGSPFHCFQKHEMI